MTKKNVLCYKCNKPIDELNDNFMKMISYNEGDIIHEVWFHLNHGNPIRNCWSEFNDEKIQSRLTEMSKMGFGILRNMGMVS